ncbi:MAG: hypothetical protein ACO3RV_06880 [Luteolibacter sp.]
MRYFYLKSIYLEPLRVNLSDSGVGYHGKACLVLMPNIPAGLALSHWIT